MDIKQKQELKTKVRKLRATGKTYTEIMNTLHVSLPKSTISNWCSNVSLPDWYEAKIEKLNAKNFSRAQKVSRIANQLKREKLLNDLHDNNRHLIHKVKDIEVRKMLLAMLYLGEGSKWKSHRGLMLGSSDPDIIRLYIRLLEQCYGIPVTKLSCWVGHRADQNLTQLKRYWAKITSISLKKFYKSIPDPRTVGKPTKRKDYKGVAVISCAGTHIQLELEMIPKIILAGL